MPVVRHHLVTERGGAWGGASAQFRRYIKSVSGVSDVAIRALGLRRRRVISSGVSDVPDAVSPT